MKTIPIKCENDYAQIFSVRSGCNCTADSNRALTSLCEMLIPAVSERASCLNDLLAWRPYSYAPTLHIELKKETAPQINAIVEEYNDVIDDLMYLDTNEYEQHEEIESCPTDIVDISFCVWNLSKLNDIIYAIANKLGELEADAKASLNFIFPEGEGVYLDYDGNVTDTSYDPSLVWEIKRGKVEMPHCRMVIYGDDVDNLLYYGYYLFSDISVAEWRDLLGVEIEVGFKDEND